jgi:hypothetical protein
MGDWVDGRTREAKFLKAIEAELTEHLGGQPSAVQVLAIRRIARLTLQAELLDQKLHQIWDSGGGVGWSERDTRILTDLHRAIRMCLKEIGMRPAAGSRPPAIQEIIARYAT